jgi:hypothetical protein
MHDVKRSNERNPRRYRHHWTTRSGKQVMRLLAAAFVLS